MTDNMMIVFLKAMILKNNDCSYLSHTTYSKKKKTSASSLFVAVHTGNGSLVNLPFFSPVVIITISIRQGARMGYGHNRDHDAHHHHHQGTINRRVHDLLTIGFV